MPVQLPPLNYFELGQLIRRQRNKQGMSQFQLADQIPCSKTYVSRIENGDKPSLEVLVRLAELLNFSLDNLLGLQSGRATPKIPPAIYIPPPEDPPIPPVADDSHHPY